MELSAVDPADRLNAATQTLQFTHNVKSVCNWTVSAQTQVCHFDEWIRVGRNLQGAT